jgi:hypothetical protein
MKMKEHYTDDFGNIIADKDITLGMMLRARLDSAPAGSMVRCTTEEMKSYNKEQAKQPVMITRKKDMNKTVDETLEQRGNNYGDYRDVAYAAQQLKKTLRYSKSWHSMEPFMQESLDMICNKMSRIVNGNPYYDDSWHDIAGYATLVEKQLEKK